MFLLVVIISYSIIITANAIGHSKFITLQNVYIEHTKILPPYNCVTWSTTTVIKTGVRGWALLLWLGSVMGNAQNRWELERGGSIEENTWICEELLHSFFLPIADFFYPKIPMNPKQYRTLAAPLPKARLYFSSTSCCPYSQKVTWECYIKHSNIWSFDIKIITNHLNLSMNTINEYPYQIYYDNNMRNYKLLRMFETTS